MYVMVMGLITLYLVWRVIELKKQLKKVPSSNVKQVQVEEPPYLKEVDEFFVSDEAKLIFVLLYVENEERAKLLGIEEEMYESIELAKSWKSKIVKKIHPDRCKHPKATEAMSKVNSIYARMKKYAQ